MLFVVSGGACGALSFKNARDREDRPDFVGSP